MNQRKMLPDLMLLGVALGLPLFILIGPFAFYFLVIEANNDANIAQAIVAPPELSDHAAALATLAVAIDRPAFQPSVSYSASMVRSGQSAYLGTCAACHGTNARGITGLGKTLLGSPFVRDKDDVELTTFVIQGRTIWDAANTTGVAMPARGGNPGLSDQDIRNIVAYIRVTDGTAVVGDGSGVVVANPPADDTPRTPAEPVEYTPIDITALTGGGSGGSETTETPTRSGRDGATLATAFCEVDDTSRTMCDYLSSVDDQTRLIDLLTNGSSPFDSNIPQGVFIPQRGGTLFFSDDEVLNLIDYWHPPSDSTSSSTAIVRPGRDGQSIEEALCEVDEASRAVCAYLQSLVSNDGANYDRLIDLLKNGSSPFDTNIPQGMYIPQRGGHLLLSDDEVLNFIDYLYAQAGFASPGQHLTTTPPPSVSEVTVAPDRDRDGATVYDELCTVNENSQAMCDYLLAIIVNEQTDRERLFTLLVNGSSPFDSTIPQGIFIPQRGGMLILKDAEIQNLIDYLYSKVAEETGDVGGMTYMNRLQGSVIYPPRQVIDFTLPATTGENFSLNDQRGKLVLVYFGYLTCPDVCPATLVDMMRAYREAGEPKDEVTMVFITIDPERDNLEIMSRYLAAFHPDFIGLRPESQAQLETMLDSFGVTTQRREVDSELVYLMDHSATVFLVGPDGRVVTQFPFGVPYTEIANDLTVLMAYTVAPEKFTGGRYITTSNPEREYRIVIPSGTFSQIMMGNDPGIIPLKIELTLGERDVLVLENHDNADYLVGGIWVAPYETVRKQFYKPQSFIGLCTVTVGRDLVEIIVSEPVN